MSTKKDQIFTSENYIPESKKVFPSPSGKFVLITKSYHTGEGTWNYTRGQVMRCGDSKIIADVKRNYDSFWHLWVDHVNGNEYLLCGEDYQGQTIVNATQGTRVDHKERLGLCWAKMCASPDTKQLLVWGCYWGAPYELAFFDLSDPDTLPLPKLFACPDFPEQEDVEWVEQDKIRIIQRLVCRKSDGLYIDEIEPYEKRREFISSADYFDSVFEKDVITDYSLNELKNRGEEEDE